LMSAVTVPDSSENVLFFLRGRRERIGYLTPLQDEAVPPPLWLP
jgi:hypothetical protein